MRSISSVLLLSAASIPFVACSWIDTYNAFADLQYWYGDANTGSPFNPLRWLGGNGPWFPGPDVYNLGIDPPSGCIVDQEIHVLRHGSRYPDPSAYESWVALYQKIQNSTFTATGPLAFLPSWQPVLNVPSVQLSTESITGYREAFDLAIALRSEHPSFYTSSQPYHVFANDYPRVIETAQNFLRAFLGVNASHGLGTVYAVTSTGTGALGNSLAPSDLCPNYVDSSGANQTAIWDALTLPPVVKRISQYITSGSLNITTTDVSNMLYLCGFETSITGTPSPFCSLFEEPEFKDYEYHQDLRYYYGNGPGSTTGKYMMLPFLLSITNLLSTYNSNTTTTTTNSSTPLQPLTMAFLNDGQISQLVASLGVYDTQPPLPSNSAPSNRTYLASRFVSMRGTVSFQRLSCPSTSSPSSSSSYLRIKLNDAPLPIPSCRSGPGQTCSVTDYASYVQKKWQAIGESKGWLNICGVAVNSTDGIVQTDFWTEYASLGFVRGVVP